MSFNGRKFSSVIHNFYSKRHTFTTIRLYRLALSAAVLYEMSPNAAPWSWRKHRCRRWAVRVSPGRSSSVTGPQLQTVGSQSLPWSCVLSHGASAAEPVGSQSLPWSSVLSHRASAADGGQSEPPLTSHLKSKGLLLAIQWILFVETRVLCNDDP